MVHEDRGTKAREDRREFEGSLLLTVVRRIEEVFLGQSSEQSMVALSVSFAI